MGWRKPSHHPQSQQKTQLSEDPPEGSSQQDSGGGRRGRLKQKVIARKTGEFKQMMQEISALIKLSGNSEPPEEAGSGPNRQL